MALTDIQHIEDGRHFVDELLERHPEMSHVVIDPPVDGFGLTYESIMTEFATKVIPYATAGMAN